MAYSLTWLSEVLGDAGLKVGEQPGWRTRGHGDVDAIKGVICHHTAGGSKGNMPSLGVVTSGRPGLDGPLCQLGLGRDGTYYVVAAGRAYHAGLGVWKGITRGNSSFIGIEAENTGHVAGQLADPWPDVQMDAYKRGIAAILRKIGASVDMCCGHKEYAPGRKSDPTFNMDQFRADVSAILSGAAPAPILIPLIDAGNRPTLRRGATGNFVQLIQRKLGVPSTATFGPRTEAEVRQLQRTHNLIPDGIVGPKTLALLDTLP